MVALTVEDWVAQGNQITQLPTPKPKLIGSLGEHLKHELLDGEKSLQQLLTVFESVAQIKKAILSAEKLGLEIYTYFQDGETMYKLLNPSELKVKVSIKKDLEKSIRSYLAKCKNHGSYARYWGYIEGLHEAKKINMLQYDLVMAWWEE